MNDETSSSKKWWHLLLFIGGTVLSVGALLYLAVLYFPSPSTANTSREDMILRRYFKIPNWQTLGYRPIYDPETRTITLNQDQSYDIDGLRITYQGLDGKKVVKLDVRVLAFDPETPFHYQLPIAAAREEFLLAGRRFKLISAGRNRFEFQHLFASVAK
ncbi:MAG: hypothetical protein [Olavius algarvensis Delta 4 endosymbiont]|nr:MAG: hypothetical protein [Olavius algarvensis Delta 4 endosymbiont]